MKKPIAIISTDWHLNESNVIELYDIAEKEVARAKEMQVKDVIWLGDVFDSRVSQRQELLVALSDIIGLYFAAGLTLHIIPGNHDKTDYTDDASFLSPYRYHPGVVLIDNQINPCFKIGGIYFWALPYYSQEQWLIKFERVVAAREKITEGRHIFLSHQAIQGSINNDGSLVSNGISAKIFANFDKVFLGHYHNAQQPAKNVFHLPSVRQNNYGEDEEKGYTLLYDDTSFELLKSDFTPYREIKIDVANTTPEQLNTLAKTKDNGVNLRVVLVGTVEDVKSIDRTIFTSNGIAVKTQYEEVEVVQDEPTKISATELTTSDMFLKFKEFCADKGYSYDEGIILLKEILQWQQE